MQGLQSRLSITVRAIAVALLIGGASIATADEPDELASDLEAAMSDVSDAIDELEQYRHITEDDPADERAEARRAVREAKRTARHAAISLLLASVEPAKRGDLDKVLQAIEIIMPGVVKPKQVPRRK